MSDETPLPYIGPERRKEWHSPSDCPLAEETNRRFLDGVARMDRIEATQKETHESIKEVLEIVSMGKGFFKSVWFLGNALKWGIGIAVAVAAAWHAFKDGTP